MHLNLFNQKIIDGEFPPGSIIMVAGEPGTGKTILLSTLAHEKLKEGKKVLFVSFNEPRSDYFSNVKKLGMDMENENFRFMDLFTVGREAIEDQLSFIYEEIKKFKPDIIIIDSITAILTVMGHENVRTFLHTSLGRFIKSTGSIAFLVAEKPIGSKELGFGIEEFVVDGLIILRYFKCGEHYRRILEIPKMRGKKIRKPQYEYTITDKGIILFDIPELEREEELTLERVSTGIKKLDELLGDGYYRGSITLYVGNTGTGKTTFGLHFVYQNALSGKKAIFLTFEESKENIIRAMKNYGMDIEAVKGRLIIKDMIPEAYSPIAFFAQIMDLIESEKPDVIFMDSISSIQEHMDKNELSKMIRYLQLTVKRLGLVLCSTLNVQGNFKEVPFTGISTLSDNIILLWYNISEGKISRKLLVLKSRASNHSRKVYNFEITDKGIEIYE
ncbi:circadian clock KaiC-like protein [Archaeoglobales archaeon]|nr:MAG: circadian clock KaiC-like protein [Archaeoglobales archaeon]